MLPKQVLCIRSDVMEKYFIARRVLHTQPGVMLLISEILLHILQIEPATCKSLSVQRIQKPLTKQTPTPPSSVSTTIATSGSSSNDSIHGGPNQHHAPLTTDRDTSSPRLGHPRHLSRVRGLGVQASRPQVRPLHHDPSSL